MRVGVIGAGIAGLRAAARLSERAEVVVFEKSRGFGGRLATRRAGRFAFDHGAQYFRARDPRFIAVVAEWERRGLVAPWRARFAEMAAGRALRVETWGDAPAHYVGVPGMSAIGRAMAEGLDVRLETRIVGADFDGRWRLRAEDGGEFECDALVVAIPAPQALALLPEESPVAASARAAQMQGCFALMLGFGGDAPDPGFDAALVHDAPLSWISACHTRPGRDAAPAWVVLSANDWADAHIDDDLDTVRETLLAAAARVLGSAPPAHVALHRWRYANCARMAPGRAVVDAERRLAVCGDWLNQGRVEAAFLAGEEAAAAI